jgi:hypothetical protein
VLVLVCAGIGAAYVLTRDDDEDDSGAAATRVFRTSSACRQTGHRGGSSLVVFVLGWLTRRANDRAAGFAVNSVSRHTLDPAEDGIVIEQRPAGGTSAGAEVTITVGALTP